LWIIFISFPHSILVTALVGTACIFACFSGAAVFAKRRELLFLGGILSSATSLLLWMGFASYFFGGHASYFAVEVMYRWWKIS
jgi:FtsH-binding integral membrane protein